MFEEYLKHLRRDPIDHRLTVLTECGIREVILLTTDNIERVGCIPCLQARKSTGKGEEKWDWTPTTAPGTGPTLPSTGGEKP